jgi:hypothetical protein
MRARVKPVPSRASQFQFERVNILQFPALLHPYFGCIVEPGATLQFPNIALEQSGFRFGSGRKRRHTYS